MKCQANSVGFQLQQALYVFVCLFACGSWYPQMFIIFNNSFLSSVVYFIFLLVWRFFCSMWCFAVCCPWRFNFEERPFRDTCRQLFCQSRVPSGCDSQTATAVAATKSFLHLFAFSHLCCSSFPVTAAGQRFEPFSWRFLDCFLIGIQFVRASFLLLSALL